MTYTYTINAASVGGEFIDADDLIQFTASKSDVDDLSIETVAQTRGAELWRKIYRERADRVYYTVDY